MRFLHFSPIYEGINASYYERDARVKSQIISSYTKNGKRVWLQFSAFPGIEHAHIFCPFTYAYSNSCNRIMQTIANNYYLHETIINSNFVFFGFSLLTFWQSYFRQHWLFAHNQISYVQFIVFITFATLIRRFFFFSYIYER